jgi:predicted Rossmann fold nucleotide-binding protein DprA/Smf involved in DNA uptake
VSFGLNQLIKQGAKLVSGSEDVVNELPTPVRAEPIPVESASHDERAALIETVSGARGKAFIWPLKRR